jgi:hypothetical protein
MRSLIAAVLLTVPLWSQPKPLSTEDAAQQVREIQTVLQNNEVVGDYEADLARREAIFQRFESVLSNFVIAQVEAKPDIPGPELRDRVAQILGHTLAVFFPEPPIRKFGPTRFTVVYDSDICLGACHRTVVESYVLDQGKVRLAGRGGSEMKDIFCSAEEVRPDEVLVQGMLQNASGHALPYRVALYRVNEAGVKMVWQSPVRGEQFATTFAGHLLVEYRDQEHETAYSLAYRMDVYFLEGGVPNLVYHRDWEVH